MWILLPAVGADGAGRVEGNVAAGVSKDAWGLQGAVGEAWRSQQVGRHGNVEGFVAAAEWPGHVGERQVATVAREDQK